MIIITTGMSFSLKSNDQVNFKFTNKSNYPLTLDNYHNNCIVGGAKGSKIVPANGGSYQESFTKSERIYDCLDYPGTMHFQFSYPTYAAKKDAKYEFIVDSDEKNAPGVTYYIENKGTGIDVTTSAQPYYKRTSSKNKDSVLGSSKTYDVTVTLSDAKLKTNPINFQFKNSSHYPVTIKWNQENSNCWSPGPKEMIFIPQTVLPGKSLSLNTQVDNLGACALTSSNLKFAFSSPYHSVSVVFFAKINNELTHIYGPETGDNSLGLYTNTNSPNTTSIEFVDKITSTSPVNFVFVNSSGVNINLDKVSSTCWDLEKNLQSPIRPGQKLYISTHTHILNDSQCVNNTSSTMTLKFTGGSSQKTFTITKPFNGPITSQVDTTQKDFWALIIPNGKYNNDVAIEFIKPGKPGLLKGAPLKKSRPL
ncbi:hypothetical protein [Candidatus Bealeia paramacronuclearis]|uniref:hypothetical protein n=1 Tax=Candidatus Bealeia paramacronuclearis TaxID=1921001 RepID=UPI0030D2283C